VRKISRKVYYICLDISMALDSCNQAVLVMLDLDFNSVDHSTLLHRLNKSYYMKWTGLPHIFVIAHNMSAVLNSVQPHLGCCLGYHSVRSLAHALGTAHLLQLVKCRQLLPHAYADDTQIYGLCIHSAVNILHAWISICSDSVSDWIMANS